MTDRELLEELVVIKEKEDSKSNWYFLHSFETMNKANNFLGINWADSTSEFVNIITTMFNDFRLGSSIILFNAPEEIIEKCKQFLDTNDKKRVVYTHIENEFIKQQNKVLVEKVKELEITQAKLVAENALLKEQLQDLKFAMGDKHSTPLDSSITASNEILVSNLTPSNLREVSNSLLHSQANQEESQGASC